MIPTADYFKVVIDCRRLTISGDFYNLNRDQVLQLFEDIYSFVALHFDKECILTWGYTCNGKTKRFKIPEDLRFTIPEKQNLFSIDFYGDVRSKRVYNKTSLRKYDYDLHYGNVYSTVGLASYGYPQYAEKELDPYRGSPIELREALIRTFSQEDRIYQDINFKHDIAGGVFVHSMPEHPGYYAGEFLIEVSVLSLDDSINEMAETFFAFGKSLSEKYTRINLSVYVFQESDDEYLSYFGILLPLYKSHQKQKETGRIIKEEIIRENFLIEQANYMFIRRVGWANILSPKLCTLLPQTITEDKNDISTCILPNGALCISLDKDIGKTTLHELKRLKKFLYPALYPGLRWFMVENVGRHYWQNVPVLDDEIKVVGNKVFFSYLGEFNEEYVLSFYDFICN